ncbi:hypothetical protein BJF88_14960 [Cellulosimicrobium sp. CUA-896]|nr:hypothetical protein BJF88_14960 [Cellulosimicrobium sp. CUA-896]
MTSPSSVDMAAIWNSMCAENARASSAVTTPRSAASRTRAASASSSGVVCADRWPWSVARAPAATNAARRRRNASR